jgi:cyclohexanone monooxygenase
VFQRSPQYSVPVGNGPVSPDYVKSVKQNYDQIWKDVRSSVVAFGFKESAVPALSVSEEERRAVYQKAWERGGGFRFMFETFCDIATDEAANETAAAFIRGKIAEVVKDPETARKLTPTDLYAKRPLCDSGYYATFNRDNVSLVDVKANPIAEVTPKGIKTADGVEHELDVLIFATGFDAVDGNYTRIDLRGRNGLTIQEKWKSGPTSYLGVTNADYPNLFMILGPNGPFTNLPPSIETQVEWISNLIKHMNDTGRQVVEATRASEDGWTATCKEIAGYTLFPKADSWIFGANIPGKARTVMFYLAGLGAYTQKLNEVAGSGYPGFDIR